MPKYRQKPVVVDAIQWFESDHLKRMGYTGPGTGNLEATDPLTGVYFKYHYDASEPATPMVRLDDKHSCFITDGEMIVTYPDGSRRLFDADKFVKLHEKL